MVAIFLNPKVYSLNWRSFRLARSGYYRVHFTIRIQDNTSMSKETPPGAVPLMFLWTKYYYRKDFFQDTWRVSIQGSFQRDTVRHLKHDIFHKKRTYTFSKLQGALPPVTPLYTIDSSKRDANRIHNTKNEKLPKTVLTFQQIHLGPFAAPMTTSSYIVLLWAIFHHHIVLTVFIFGLRTAITTPQPPWKSRTFFV